MMPGTVCITTHGSRADGMFCNSWSVTLVPVPDFFASMIGDSAVTSTCVCTPPTRMAARSWTFPPAGTTTLLFA